MPLPERLERRTRGFGRLGGLLPEALYEKAIARRPAEIARINAVFDEVDVLVMPVMGGTALPVRRWQGRGALSTVLGMSRFYPYCVPWNHIGNPAMAVPFGFGADGCRSRSRSSAAPATSDAALPRRPDRGRAPLGRLRPPISGPRSAAS